ncbi:MAG TPA: hypothetical protein VJ247_08420, partial [Gaiella sp.]|nr:hypothetical protein [Gaiella sp.]
EANVGRAFSNAAVEIALASYPGCFLTNPPGSGSAYGVYEPRYVAQDVPAHTVTLPSGERHSIGPPPRTQPLEPLSGDPAAAVAGGAREAGSAAYGMTVRAPLGTIVGARSGDKGGNANVGVWVRSQDEFAWLDGFLTVARLRDLLPETRDLTVIRTRLPQIRALNFVVEGLLGEGVAYAARFDPQAKALGEWLRARHVDVPTRLLSAPMEGPRP